MAGTREYYNTRRKERRKRFLALLGNRCVRCGTKENLHFDHKNPKNKKNHVSHLRDHNDAAVHEEVKKCQLLCADCHREKTKERWEYGTPQSEHGTIWRYKKYKCRCQKCKDAMSDYYYSRT